MRFAAASFAAVTAVFVAGSQVSRLESVVHPPAKPVELDIHETNAAGSLLGQFRTSSSSWLWLKTDLYLHNGVEMRLMTNGEIRAGQQAVKDGDGWHDALGDEAKLVTTIPGQERDFRGVLGDLERATQAYQGMEGHTHIDPQATLPLFRLMTWLDPNFIPGWVTGAMVISRDRTLASSQRADQYLTEGLSHNPNSIELMNDLARLRIRQLGELERAKLLLQKAIDFGEKNFRDLNEEEVEALVQVYRWMALCEREVGRLDSARSWARRGLRTFSTDVVLSHLAEPEPLIFQKEAIHDSSPKKIETPARSSEESDHDGHDH